MKRTALVLQGGGLRGVFVAGVLDVFLENNIEFEVIFGTSAGALAGISYVTKQQGLTFKILCDYRRDRRFGSVSNLLKTRSYFNADYLFNDILVGGVGFDFEKFEASPIQFYSVTTSLKDGRACYFSKEREDFFTSCLNASMSLPLMASPIEIDGELHLDGGNSEPIPFSRPIELGYEKIVIVETRENEYQKKPSKAPINALNKRLYSNYPIYLKAVLDYSNLYNKKILEIKKLEREGRVFVIRPLEKVEVSRTEKNKMKLRDLYEKGRKVATDSLESLKGYLNGSQQ